MASPYPQAPIIPHNHAKGKEIDAEPPVTQLAERASSQNNRDSANADSGAHRSSGDVANGRADVAQVHAGSFPDSAQASSSPARLVPAPVEAIATHDAQEAASSGKDNLDAEKTRDADRDKGSLDTTVIGTQTHVRTHSPRRRVTKTASGVENSAQPLSSSKKLKRSLFSKVFSALVPCVGSSQRAHDPDIDLHHPKPSDPSTSVLKEEQEVKQADESPSVPAQEPAVIAQTVEAPSQTAPVEEAPAPPLPAPPPLPPIVTAPTPTSSNTSVILPPTPTKSLLPPEETEGMTSGAVQPPGSTGEDVFREQRTHARDSGDESDGSTSFTEDEELDEATPMDEDQDDEERLIMNGGAGIPIGIDGIPRPLLPPLLPKHAGRKCLVLDLDETLVHSSFKSIQQADYVVPVEIEYHWHNVYVIKRPGVDAFLKKMGEIYEVVVFTASLSKYADPVLDKLDIHHVVSHRLFRESCYNHRGNYVKDLSQLGRPISDTIIIDNSPASYIFHPNNAVPVSSWFNDPHDTELTDLCPFLTDLAQVEDVRGVLDGGL